MMVSEQEIIAAQAAITQARQFRKHIEKDDLEFAQGHLFCVAIAEIPALEGYLDKCLVQMSILIDCFNGNFEPVSFLLVEYS